MQRAFVRRVVLFQTMQFRYRLKSSLRLNDIRQGNSVGKRSSTSVIHLFQKLKQHAVKTQHMQHATKKCLQNYKNFAGNVTFEFLLLEALTLLFKKNKMNLPHFNEMKFDYFKIIVIYKHIP